MFEFARACAVDRDRASIEAIEIIFISWIARFQREIDGSRAVSIASLDVPTCDGQHVTGRVTAHLRAHDAISRRPRVPDDARRVIVLRRVRPGLGCLFTAGVLGMRRARSSLVPLLQVHRVRVRGDVSSVVRHGVREREKNARVGSAWCASKDCRRSGSAPGAIERCEKAMHRRRRRRRLVRDESSVTPRVQGVHLREKRLAGRRLGLRAAIRQSV